MDDSGMFLLCVAAAGITLGQLLTPTVAVAFAMLERFFRSATSLLVSTVLVKKHISGDGESALLGFLFTKAGPTANLGLEHYSLMRKYVKPLDEVISVWFRGLASTWRWTRWHGAPILFVPGEVPAVYFIRWTVRFDTLLKEVAAYHHDFSKSRVRPERRFKVYRMTSAGMKTEDADGKPAQAPSEGPSMGTMQPIGWGVEDFGVNVEGQRSSDLSLTASMSKVLRDVRFWYDKEAWYHERSISWRRGYLLHGQPGSGKTSLVRAIAEELDLPVFQFDLSGMDNATFVRQWERARASGERIVLFEDFDTVFHGRENVSGEKGASLTFDTILNSIDGIEREDGLLLFVTTNHLEHVDPALGVPDGTGRSTRPGRLDVTVQFEPLGHAGRVKIAMRILRDEVLADQLATLGASDSPAQLTERCVAHAMEALWAEYDPGTYNVPAAARPGAEEPLDEDEVEEIMKISSHVVSYPNPLTKS